MRRCELWSAKERVSEAKLEALRAVIVEGDRSVVVEDDVFAQVREALQTVTGDEEP